MGVDVLSINLDNPAKQYVSGQTISGKLLLTVSGDETTTEVVIRFFGLAQTYWTEVETRQVHRHHSIGHNSFGSHSSFGHSSSGHWDTEHETIHYNATEPLFDFAVRLYGDGNTRFRIPVGNNVFPFAFQVPTRPLPVSCSFENGYVQYGLEGRVRKPWYSVDPKTEVLPVTLFTIVDLNITPGAAHSMRVEDSRTFGCCCKRGPCFIRSFTPKFGFIPGEVIPCVIEVNNTSNQLIMNLTATLTQMWTLFADGRQGRHMRTHPLALQAAGHPGVSPGQGVTWEINFQIPATVPPTPNQGACGIVQMEYIIQISVAVEGGCGNNNFGTTHPIIIGTIPLVPIAIVRAHTPTISSTTESQTDSEVSSVRIPHQRDAASPHRYASDNRKPPHRLHGTQKKKQRA